VLALGGQELEGGAGAVITSTGMSAVALVLQLVKPGALVLAAHDCYGGTQRLLRALASRGLIEVVFADLTCVTGDASSEIARRRPRLDPARRPARRDAGLPRPPARPGPGVSARPNRRRFWEAQAMKPA